MSNARMAKRAAGGFLLTLFFAVAAAAADSPAGPGSLRVAEDLNPAPDVLEVRLTAKRTTVDLSGDGLLANAYTFNGTTPGPELRARVGDTVIVHFTNQLAEPMRVHWHGIELDNANDGTAVTQNPVPTGATFTYRFRIVRPGVFWYHSHAMPSNPEFKGLYGPLIVEDPAATPLLEAGVLPGPANTRTLMLADTTVCKAPGQNDAATFAPGATVPWAFSKELGPFPGNVAYPTPKDLCETPRDRHGKPLGSGPLQAGDIPNIQPPGNCGGKTSCRVNEGQLVLSNGRIAAARAGTPEAPGALAADAEVIEVGAGEGVRLRLVNAAVSRYFRLRATDPRGRQVPLYRIGGQGGLLDTVRLEGGMLGEVDTKFARGEILLANGERADVVLAAAGEPGDVLTLWTLDYQHYGTTEYPFGYAPVPTVPVAHIRLVKRAAPGAAFSIAAGDALRTHRLVRQPIENIKTLPVTGALLNPAGFEPPLPGTAASEILFTVVGRRESIDGVHALPLEVGVDDFRKVPHQASSRFARIGDLLELRIRNGTQAHHPMHLHGFSYQPVRIEDTVGKTVYTYDYNEFVDTVDVPATHQVVFRVRLDDRGAVDGPASGGGIGRWLLHCHIFSHTEMGMISEIVVLPR
ncbi:MAG: multicopper oxidase domain-containing protein [Gammaproteobacteria bacterium]|nr:MAG: multicopper oxidase domain-containing protein [Gammaproteobacteria bacterium]